MDTAWTAVAQSLPYITLGICIGGPVHDHFILLPDHLRSTRKFRLTPATRAQSLLCLHVYRDMAPSWIPGSRSTGWAGQSEGSQREEERRRTLSRMLVAQNVRILSAKIIGGLQLFTFPPNAHLKHQVQECTTVSVSLFHVCKWAPTAFCCAILCCIMIMNDLQSLLNNDFHATSEGSC